MQSFVLLQLEDSHPPPALKGTYGTVSDIHPNVAKAHVLSEGRCDVMSSPAIMSSIDHNMQ